MAVFVVVVLMVEVTVVVINLLMVRLTYAVAVVDSVTVVGTTKA